MIFANNVDGNAKHANTMLIIVLLVNILKKYQINGVIANVKRVNILIGKQINAWFAQYNVVNVMAKINAQFVIQIM